jgi:hypothetical protein
MRKGSTKYKDTSSLPVGNVVSLAQPVEIIYSTKSTKLDDFRESQILDILIRICDACHEMDNRIEPWASIRKDIERLK